MRRNASPRAYVHVPPGNAAAMREYDLFVSWVQLVEVLKLDVTLEGFVGKEECAVGKS